MLSLHSEFKKNFCLLNVLKTSFDFAEELSDMRKQMKALEEKNVTYMKETMNLQEVGILKFDQNATHIYWRFLLQWSSVMFDYISTVHWQLIQLFYHILYFIILSLAVTQFIFPY